MCRSPDTGLRKMELGMVTFRIATFNLESLDTQGRDDVRLQQRIDVLRPQIVRLSADILCLQEVNAQRVPGESQRAFHALDRLLEETPYSLYQRATSHGAGGKAADVHNLVILSRYPILEQRELLHQIVPPQHYRQAQRTTRPETEAADPVTFDRPILLADIALSSGMTLTVANVHLRAPRATALPGEKLSAMTWASTAGWAEGFFVASLKRNAQALELRLEIDRILDADSRRMIAIAGDLNAQDGETALKILRADEDDTGNSALASRSLVPMELSLPQQRRFTVVHRGRALMLDHILVTRDLLGRAVSVAVHNETLVDEAPDPLDPFEERDGALELQARLPLGSLHAPMVAEFALENPPAIGP